MELICTNNTYFYNYLQEKGVKCFLYLEPVEINGVLNIFFPETHNITICGNRYNKERIESGNMKREFEQLKKLIELPNMIVITPITLYNGVLHAQLYPESMLDVPHQTINTGLLNEVVYPHNVCIYNATLKPLTNKMPRQGYVEYGNEGKKQQDIYWNVFYEKTSKEERRRKRKIPQYALYSALYNQIILRGDNNGKV